MVAAPYNMQVRLLRRTPQAAGLGDVPVSSVAKFHAMCLACIVASPACSNHARGPSSRCG
jgi:hypothetical protein